MFKFLASTVPYAPFADEKVLENGQIGHEGIEVDMARNLAHVVNAKLVIRRPAQGSWGRDKGNI